MSTSMYEDYDDFSGDYNYPYSFDGDRKDYMESTYKPTVSWNYLETPTLTFTLTDVPSDVATYVINFYNYRHTVVYSVTLNEANSDLTLTVIINADESKNKFVKGLYTAEVIAYYTEDSKEKVKVLINDTDYNIKVN